MRTNLALALFWPALLVAQDSVRQQATSPELQKWREEQAALAATNDAERIKRRQQTEKAVVDLDRKGKVVLQALADVFGDSDPQGLDFRFHRQADTERRPRVEAEEQSAMRLDSTRRAGQPVAILSVLSQRRLDAEKFATEGDTLVVLWKELLTRAVRAQDYFRFEDKPSNPPNRKAYVKASIDHHERVVKHARAVIDFESKRSAALHTEASSLEKQIASGRAAMGGGGPERTTPSSN